MRGIGAQLGQICRIDVLFGARGRSHYGLQSCLSTEWELWNARWGGALVVGTGQESQASSAEGWMQACARGFEAETPLGPSPAIRRMQVELGGAVQCSTVWCSEHGSFE
jgi:hypothetical protein